MRKGAAIGMKYSQKIADQMKATAPANQVPPVPAPPAAPEAK
jgi:hypothetical protein